MHGEMGKGIDGEQRKEMNVFVSGIRTRRRDPFTYLPKYATEQCCRSYLGIHAYRP